MRRLLPLAALALLGAAPPRADPAINARVFDRAWALVGRRYWDRTMHGLDWEAMRARYEARALGARDPRALYAAINDMLGELHDSHVYATSPALIGDERSRLKSREESGFGFEADAGADGRWTIRALRLDGPAARAGVRLGWRLLAVDGADVDIERHFGAGDRALLLLEDEDGARHSVTMIGTPLPPDPPTRARWLPGRTLLLGFDGFDPGVERWLARQLAQAPAAVVLDLRENGGGESGVLDRVAGLFVAERPVILRLAGRRGIEETASGDGGYRGPLALLVGPRSASAAEALAAFLDEQGRAATVGETTSGALTGGVDYRLPDGGSLSVAEYDIRTGGGRRLEGIGFAPRERVAPTLAELRAGKDPALARALALLGQGERRAALAGPGAEAPGATRSGTPPPTRPQAR